MVGYLHLQDARYFVDADRALVIDDLPEGYTAEDAERDAFDAWWADQGCDRPPAQPDGVTPEMWLDATWDELPF